jgi:3-oxoacyl-[acyl-carrier protein] reductase
MLDGQVALVTGATRGIGRAIAETLARDGAIVVGTATTDEGAASISAYLAAVKGGGQGTEQRRGEGVRLDVTDAQSVSETIADVQARLGEIAILVNNAGITRDNLALRMRKDDWNAVLETNLTGAFRAIQQVLQGMMRERWGRIINVTSIVGQAGNAGQANYAASKAGLIGLTKAMAQEMASRQITVNAVSPGFIETDMTSGLSSEIKAKVLEAIPLRRLGKAEDVAAAVRFLASEEAGFITGHVLAVNGGMYM